MDAGEDAGADRPDFVAIEVVGGNEHLFLVEEGNVDVFAIGGGSAGGPAVFAMQLFDGCFEDGFLPDGLSGLSIKLEKESFGGVFVGGDEKDGVFPDDWRGVANAGDGCFPFEIFVERPCEWSFLIRADAVAGRSAPTGPVVGQQ